MLKFDRSSGKFVKVSQSDLASKCSSSATNRSGRQGHEPARPELPASCYPIVPIRDGFSRLVVYSHTPELRQGHAEGPALPHDLYQDLAQRRCRFVVIEHSSEGHTFADFQRRPPPLADALRLKRTRQLAVEIAPPTRPRFVFVCRRLLPARRRGERTGLLDRAHPPRRPEPPTGRRRRHRPCRRHRPSRPFGWRRASRSIGPCLRKF